MKKGQSAIGWIAEQFNPASFACATPDTKGSLVKLVCENVGKRRRMFRYAGVQIPAAVIKEIGKKYPGFVIATQDHIGPMNAALAYCQTPEEFQQVWHCPTVLYFTEAKPADAAPIARFPNEPTLWIIPARNVPQRQFKVNTRNCVEDRRIQHNVINSLGLGLPCLPVCAAHGERAVIAGGGPSVVNYLDEFKSVSDIPGYRLCCVKSSHNLMADIGVTPWACFLLDPRDHVKDFIEDPMPGVKYFVSSTCAPTTFERLLSRNAEVWLYHALVGASEDSLVRLQANVLNQERARFAAYCKQLGVPPMEVPDYRLGDQMVTGGTTAAARGISVLHMLGFRYYILRGFDSCYYEPKDMREAKKDGQPLYHQLSLGGKNFTTNAELTAQVQDFQHIIQSGMLPDVTFDVHGDGMIPTLFKTGWRAPKQLTEVFPQ